ncbi:MAG: response regulator [Cyanobacteria bacterium P01_D01_bin.1]
MSNVLIVEDEDKLAAFVARGFKKYGFTTAVATDGAQALQMSQTNAYDAIVLDLGLPIKDGWSVLKEIRSRGDCVPVIITTAQSECRQAAIAARANDYLQKPFRFQQLLEIVRHQIKD